MEDKKAKKLNKVISDHLEKDYPQELGPEDSMYVGSIDDVYRKAFLSGMGVGFAHGYTCACAHLVKLTGNADGTDELDMYNSNFHSIKDLKKLGVEDHDIETLTPTIKYLEKKRKINRKLDGHS